MDKDTKIAIVGIIILLVFIIILTYLTDYLIDKNRVHVLVTVIFFMSFWIFWLYVQRNEVKRKYKQLLEFSFDFYRFHKVTTEGDDDCSVGQLEDEFREWQQEKQDNEDVKRNNN
jgi:hypothetical protein